MKYDAHKDSKDSWQLAIAEIRKRGVQSGKFKPITDEEMELIRKSNG